ncbi:MAG TPA: phosphodiesterase [Rhodocyclaceae bacterium]|nr:phosphodiesterase [Rhodocyclaceae bacterium]
MQNLSALQRLRDSTRVPAPQERDPGSIPGAEAIGAFRELHDSRRLNVAFQPIIDFRGRQFLGFEGLVRGPADSPLHSPAQLFSLANAAGLAMPFEALCREVVATQFAQRKLPGLLFLNASITGLADPGFSGAKTADLLGHLGLPIRNIVIELTENQYVNDFRTLREVLDIYRRQGYRIAVDDLGEGFSNLRIWSEVRPDFVKIDRHFISGIANDNLKFQLVRAMHEIAESNDVHLVAEGIETERELAAVRDLGIAYGQGFLVARPDPAPPLQPPESILKLIQRCSVVVFPRIANPRIGSATVKELLTTVTPLHPECDNDVVFSRFEQNPDLIALPVVDGEWRPIGMVNRYSLVDRFARPFRRELFGRRSCTLFMDDMPLVVDEATSIQDVSQKLSQSAHHHMFDGFVVTSKGRYLGIGSSHALMARITDLQIRAARYANPLTQLPGNVPIHEHLERLLAMEAAFVACYCDLDNFKPYNDTYGYRRGDDLIQMLGNLLVEACDSRIDFVGHIGGDDFMLLLQSHDWAERLSLIMRGFDERLPGLLDRAHIEAGGYGGEDRKGHPVFHALPSLSMGCVVIEPGTVSTHHEVAAAVGDAKKQAKKVAGSFIFVERRKHGPDHRRDNVCTTQAKEGLGET